MTFYETFKTVCLLLVSLVAFVYIISPDIVGEWAATRDIAYDRVLSEYLGHCDCHELVE